MTRGGINLMLKRWGFSYTRPTYTLKRADKNKQESFERQLKVIKKLRRRVHLFIRRRMPYP
ncbi:winged helix-turn-helix domain-containing protein [Peribacillus loiseleuriae]|uniref:winged helix-turn-helix domain-containing protein n=1 Tax=Peribacillus loiseleuriae TaxID=1679170 RepID=UPI0037F7134B